MTRARPSVPREYSRAYFDKWYRDPRYRVKTARDLERQVRFVLAAADYLLDRPVRSVLDVGCGEGQWRPALRRLRPGIRYHGVDASEYAVRRFGRRRNIRLGSIDDLDSLGLPSSFDLVLCVGMLNYLTSAQLRRGLAQVEARCAGVAYLEIFTREDDGVVGDLRRRDARPAASYRRLMRSAGLVSCGMHCYVPEELRENTAVLERIS